MEKNPEPIKWTTEKVKVKELVPYHYNPRKSTPERLAKLKASLSKFNLAEIPVANTDNTIIAGHQRVKILMELGRGDEIIDARFPNRKLTENEFKEYNVTSNVPVGFWDMDILQECFQDIDLDALGLDVDAIGADVLDEQEQISEFENDFKKINSTPEFPIVAKFNEKYSAVVIIATNTTDLTFIQTVLDLNKEASYKSDRVGQTHVITADKFQKLWEKK
jgi:L-fucose mutarotase/ribose pyranase (RbsD/FucU family)